MLRDEGRNIRYRGLVILGIADGDYLVIGQQCLAVVSVRQKRIEGCPC